MITTILIAFALVAVTVAIHAAGLALLVESLRKRPNWRLVRNWRFTGLLMLMGLGLVVLHLVEISTWGLFYLWSGSMPDLQSALYFSGITYTTIGYGDLLLPTPWRLLAPIEGMTGVLMGGLSASFFFSVVNQIITTVSPKAARRTR
jgi:hypothetical protein